MRLHPYSDEWPPRKGSNLAWLRAPEVVPEGATAGSCQQRKSFLEGGHLNLEGG